MSKRAGCCISCHGVRDNLDMLGSCGYEIMDTNSAGVMPTRATNCMSDYLFRVAHGSLQACAAISVEGALLKSECGTSDPHNL